MRSRPCRCRCRRASPPFSVNFERVCTVTSTSAIRSVLAGEPNFARLQEVAKRLAQFQPQGGADSSTLAETVLEAWSSVAETQLRWGLQGEGVASVDSALAWYQRLAERNHNSSDWGLRLERFGDSLVALAFPAILRRQGLGTGAGLILEAAATYSPEDVLYSAALVAREVSTQTGRIDQRLAAFLEEAPAALGP